MHRFLAALVVGVMVLGVVPARRGAAGPATFVNLRTQIDTLFLAHPETLTVAFRDGQNLEWKQWLAPKVYAVGDSSALTGVAVYHSNDGVTFYCAAGDTLFAAADADTTRVHALTIAGVRSIRLIFLATTLDTLILAGYFIYY